MNRALSGFGGHAEPNGDAFIPSELLADDPRTLAIDHPLAGVLANPR
jgi:hypothetical protein